MNNQVPNAVRNRNRGMLILIGITELVHKK